MKKWIILFYIFSSAIPLTLVLKIWHFLDLAKVLHILPMYFPVPKPRLKHGQIRYINTTVAVTYY